MKMKKTWRRYLIIILSLNHQRNLCIRFSWDRNSIATIANEMNKNLWQNCLSALCAKGNRHHLRFSQLRTKGSKRINKNIIHLSSRMQLHLQISWELYHRLQSKHIFKIKMLIAIKNILFYFGHSFQIQLDKTCISNCKFKPYAAVWKCLLAFGAGFRSVVSVFRSVFVVVEN